MSAAVVPSTGSSRATRGTTQRRQGWGSRGLVAAIRLYRVTLSPLLGPACRFAPSCSEYAIDAVERHGVARGSWLAARRLARCHPLGGSGYDPVPDPRHQRLPQGD